MIKQMSSRVADLTVRGAERLGESGGADGRGIAGLRAAGCPLGLVGGYPAEQVRQLGLDDDLRLVVDVEGSGQLQWGGRLEGGESVRGRGGHEGESVRVRL